MFITNLINEAADGITGFTDAGAAFSTAIIGWVLFWTRIAKLIPTEWRNPYLRKICKILNMTCRIIAFDWADIAKVQFHPLRIITRQELIATQVVQAAVIEEAVKVDPPAPAAPASMTDIKL